MLKHHQKQRVRFFVIASSGLAGAIAARADRELPNNFGSRIGGKFQSNSPLVRATKDFYLDFLSGLNWVCPSQLLKTLAQS